MMLGVISASAHDNHDGSIWQEWTSDNRLPDSPGNYYLTKDVTLSIYWMVPAGTTNLCLNGCDIKRNGRGECIAVKTGSTLNLYDCGTPSGNITHPNNDKGRGVVVSGTFNMYGGIIKDNACDAEGGGVNVYNQGLFNMYGDAMICDNSAGRSGPEGGGVGVFHNSRFVMYGGTITNNNGKSGYENIYVSGGCFIRKGGIVGTEGNEGIGYKNDNTVMIQFDSNGGSGTMYPQYIAMDTSTVLPDNSFTRQYYSFKYWTAGQDGSGTKYYDMANISLNSNTTLYAQWLLLPSATVTTKTNANDSAQEQITIGKKPTLKKPKPKKNKATITWNKLQRKNKKQKALWKQIKQIEVEWSTDPSFPKDLTGKKTLGKRKTKTNITGLQRKTTYFVRVRYSDGNGGYSLWSKVKRFRTK